MAINDLYSGLIYPKLRKGKNGEDFWGRYDILDSVEIPDNTEFLEIQIKNLKALEAQKRYYYTQKFLKNPIYVTSDDVENEAANQAAARIIEILNMGLRGSDFNQNRKNKTEQQITSEIQALMEELKQLLNQLQVDGSISAQFVDVVESRLSHFNWGNEAAYKYIQEKSALAEEVATAQMSLMPELKAVTTGSWIDEAGKQLIEDNLAFTKEGLNKIFDGDIKLSFWVTVDGKKISGSASSIGDFLQQIEKIKGKKITIKLSDELYDVLQQRAAITSQVKSGTSGQSILNKNSRNSLTLYDVNFDPRLIWNLYEEHMISRVQYFKEFSKQNSQALVSLTNFCLSKEIGKTAIKRNSLYLTEDGFITASQWMSKYGKYLIFDPPINRINKSFMTQLRRYIFTA